MKSIRLITYASLVVGTLALIAFAFMTGRSYLDIHASVKTRVEYVFLTMPGDSYIRHTHFDYLKATGRGHYNGVTFLNDGRLMLDTLENRAYVHERAESIAFLSEYLYDRGTPFLYVRAPSKLQDNSFLPTAFSDNNIIANADALVYLLNSSGVDTLDLRAKMENDGIAFPDAFFKGDHHWTADTIFWAFGSIAEFIGNEYGITIDRWTWDAQHYEHITFEGAFLGEEAVAVGANRFFEDISFKIPKFHTDITVTNIWDPSNPHLVSRGSFTEVFTPALLDGSRTRFGYVDMNVPHRYFNRYENAAVSEDKKVLLIMDSMGIPLATFFSTAFRTVDNFYLVNRQNNRIWSEINSNDYDLVIFLVSDVVVSFENEYPFTNDRLYLSRPH